MIDHFGITVSNFDAAKAFYLAALAPIGVTWQATVPPEHTGGVKVGGMGQDRATFWLSEGEAHKPALHFAFAAASRADVDAFYDAAIAAGAKDNGKPGPRPQYHDAYYGAFVIDPDGNNVEAVCHLPE